MTRTSTLVAEFGRDCGKRFVCREIEPLAAAKFTLRLVAAMHVDSYDGLLSQLDSSDDVPLDGLLQLLQGSNPEELHALLNELLDYVQIAPDAATPTAVRPLGKQDIAELRTLGTVAMQVIKLTFGKV